VSICNEGLNVLARHLLQVIAIIRGQPRMAESNRIDWRELCAAAVKEPDSEKLADLVDQIIKALDERALRLAAPTQFVQL
jgi:hypothetical protein